MTVRQCVEQHSKMHSFRSATELKVKPIEMTSSLVPGCNMIPCRMTRTQKFILVSMSLLKFVAMASFSVIAPFYPSEAKLKAVSEVVIGAVFTVYAASNFLTSPLFGKIIASIGPKLVLLTGTCVLGMSSLLFGLLDDVTDSHTFASLSVAVRLFQGAGCGAAGTAIFTYIAEVFPRRTGMIMGVMEVMTAVGLATGPAVGGYLYTVGGYKAPFVVLGMICLATVPVNAILLPRSARHEGIPLTPSRRQGYKKVSKWNLVINPRFLIAALSISAVSCGTAFLSPLLEPHLRKLGMGPSEIGMMFLFTPLAYGFISPISGYISDENPPWRRLQVAFGLFFVGWSFLLIGPSPLLRPLKRLIEPVTALCVLWLNIVALLVKGLGSTFAVVPTFQIMLDIAIDIGVPDDLATHGMISGLWSSSWSFGEIVGPTLGTVLSSHFGFGWAATGEALFSFIIMFLIGCSQFAQRKEEDVEADESSSNENSPLIPS